MTPPFLDQSDTPLISAWPPRGSRYSRPLAVRVTRDSWTGALLFVAGLTLVFIVLMLLWGLS